MTLPALAEQPVEVKVSATVMKPTEQSVEHSSHRSEEVSESTNFVEYSTEQSSEKWDDSSSGSSSETATYTTSEETSSEASTELLMNKLNEIVQQPLAVEPVTMNVSVSTTPDSTVSANRVVTSEATEPTLKDTVTEEDDRESLADLDTSDDEYNSTDEELATTSGFITWFTDPISSPSKQQIDAIFKETNAAFDDESKPAITGSTLVDDTLPTTTVTSVEMDSSTAQDSASNSGEQSDEVQLTSLNLDNQETTTAAAAATATAAEASDDDDDSYFFQTESEQTALQDTSTIPSDAQHAIHKIIESLQSINDDSASDETEEADSQEAPYTVDIPGMSYDTDAQSSINAIIQSLGQGALGGSESGIFSIATTTDMITTSGETEPTTTVSEATVKNNSPTKASISTTEKISVPSSTPLSSSSSSVPDVAKTPKPDVVESTETEPETGSFNYNTNIMDTIEKFLSSFASLPKESSYAANLTKMNILSDYPAEINMTPIAVDTGGTLYAHTVWLLASFKWGASELCCLL